eukprot:7172372-Prymnesium_polylepis.4
MRRRPCAPPRVRESSHLQRALSQAPPALGRRSCVQAIEQGARLFCVKFNLVPSGRFCTVCTSLARAQEALLHVICRRILTARRPAPQYAGLVSDRGLWVVSGLKKLAPVLAHR